MKNNKHDRSPATIPFRRLRNADDFHTDRDVDERTHINEFLDAMDEGE